MANEAHAFTNPRLYEQDLGQLVTDATNAALGIAFGPDQIGISDDQWRDSRAVIELLLEGAEDPAAKSAQDLAMVGLANALLKRVGAKHELSVALTFEPKVES